MIGKLSLMGLILAVGTCAAHAQAQYPDKPVKTVVPVAAGGGVDVAIGPCALVVNSTVLAKERVVRA